MDLSGKTVITITNQPVHTTPESTPPSAEIEYSTSTGTTLTDDHRQIYMRNRSIKPRSYYIFKAEYDWIR